MMNEQAQAPLATISRAGRSFECRMSSGDRPGRPSRAVLAALLLWLAMPACALASAWLPLQVLRTGDIGGLLCVDVAQGAYAGRWLIDTGSGVNLAAPQTAERYRTSDAQRIGLHTAQGTRHGAAVELPGFAIGELPPVTLKAVEFDLVAFVGAAAENLAGVLGAPFLDSLRLELDLPNARVRFLPTGTASAAASDTTAPVTLALKRVRGLPVLQVQIDDRPAEGFLFDTGHAGALVRLAGGDVGRAPPPAGRQMGLARRVMIGSVLREKVPVVDAADSALGRALPAGVVGSAGVALFERCRIALELRAQRLELAGCDSATLRGGFGLQLQHDARRLSISQVLAGSPAERAGLRAGDEILRIAGRQQFETLGSAWHELANTAEVEVVVRRGSGELVRHLKRAHFLPPLP